MWINSWGPNADRGQVIALAIPGVLTAVILEVQGYKPETLEDAVNIVFMEMGGLALVMLAAYLRPAAEFDGRLEKACLFILTFGVNAVMGVIAGTVYAGPLRTNVVAWILLIMVDIYHCSYIKAGGMSRTHRWMMLQTINGTMIKEVAKVMNALDSQGETILLKQLVVALRNGQTWMVFREQFDAAIKDGSLVWEEGEPLPDFIWPRAEGVIRGIRGSKLSVFLGPAQKAIKEDRYERDEANQGPIRKNVL